MQYFGVPICPYCKKRVNLIRTWSLKRQGEYKCPRCGGISNIYLSPLIYVFAVIAIFAGGAIYFFHKFILDDVSLSTVLQVIIPFIVFFLLSLFQVYLAKPVIKRVSREELEAKKRGARRGMENRRMPVTDSKNVKPDYRLSDHGEFNPRMDYVTWPIQQPDEDDVKIHLGAVRREPESKEDLSRTSVVKLSPEQAALPEEEVPVRLAADEISPRRVAPQREAPANRARRTGDSVPASRGNTPPAQPRRGDTAPDIRHDVPVQRRAESSVRRPEAGSGAVRPAEPVPSARVVSSVEIPSVSDDFFAKYEDPAYVEQRLRELKEKKN